MEVGRLAAMISLCGAGYGMDENASSGGVQSCQI